jgi:glutathione S-transferase
MSKQCHSENAGQLRLYSGPLSMFGAKAEIALHEKGLPFELIMVPFDMARLYEPKLPEVLRVNPKHQVPVLIHGAVEIFDSTQIFECLEDLAPEPRLWPASREGRARARLIELQSDEVYFPHIIRLMGLQDRPDDPMAIAARNAASAFYVRMEEQIGKSNYLAGSYSFADIAFFMAQFFGDRMGVPIGSHFPALVDWRARVASHPAVSAVLSPMAAFLKSQGRQVPAWAPV